MPKNKNITVERVQFSSKYGESLYEQIKIEAKI